MDRRLLHKTALVGGGLVLIAGAIIVLRDPDSGQSTETAPLPPQQTTVQAFADKSVLVPEHGERPQPPGGLTIRARERRLVVGWGPTYLGQPEPANAAGYEVRWGQGSSLTHTRYVAQPVVQLDGLDDDVQYTVAVRTIDAFGQRSDPVRGVGRPSAAVAQDPALYTMVDRFDGDQVPNPALWRLVGIGNCTRAARGAGEDNDRLIVTGQCGSSDEAVALRARAPLRLLDPKTAPNGELGRFVVQTDRPGQNGELMLDLVPGDVDLVGRPPQPSAGPDQPGRAGYDDSLPPGTIRVRISGRAPAAGGTSVRVEVAPGTPLLGRPIAVAPMPPPEIGISVRWEVVLRTDGVLVERDGVVVGGGDVVPVFSGATALISFARDSGLHAAIDLIGFTGAPTSAPEAVPAPRIDFDRVAEAPGGRVQTSPNGRRVPGATSGQLRITLVPQRDQNPVNQFTVDIGGQLLPARLAVPGQPMRNGVRLPIVADVPQEALVLGDGADFIPIVVHAVGSEDGEPTQVLTAELELHGEPGSGRNSRPNVPPLERPNPALAVPSAELLDASGTPIPALQEVPRGRLVLDVIADAVSAQRASGSVAGLAGLEISIDGRSLAGIPTALEGPGVGGEWRIALNTTGLTPGGHTIQVSAIGVTSSTASGVSYAAFVLK